MKLSKIALLVVVFVFTLILRPAQAQPGLITSTTALILDNSHIVAGSYSETFGNGNGVYLAVPDGTPPANNIPYYLWPGGAQEAINANVQTVANATAPSGAGAWQSTIQPANDGKLEVLFQPHEIFGNGTYTLSDVNSIVWQTNKVNPQTDRDWYISIWLDAGGGNVAFLRGDPYLSNNLNAPANTWNIWTADATAGGTNEIRFFEPGFACTDFGWLGPPMPTLAELVAGPYTWNNVPSQNFVPGCAGTPNPLTTTIDYSVMPILGIAVATGNPWAGPFNGLVDALDIRLDHPSIAGREDRLFVDFEVNAPVIDPTIDKAFAPATVNAGDNSTLTFTITNGNVSPLGDVTFTDNLPAGLTVANPANVAGNTCSGIVTAVAGSGTIGLDGGFVDTTCTFSVDVVASGGGTFINTSSGITTTSLNFPAGTGGDDATASLVVNPAPTPTLTQTPIPTLTAVPSAGGGTVVSTAVPFLAQVEELPATGETPLWRNWLVSIMGITVLSAVVIALMGLRRRTNKDQH